MTEKHESETLRHLHKHFLRILRDSKEQYLASMKEYERSRGTHSTEAWSDYNSGLLYSPNSSARGYFWKDMGYNFHGLDDFDARKLVEYMCAFLKRPENKDRELVFLDAMGQGVPAVELRSEILKRIPTARITIIASTFKPSGNNTSGVIEFNGDTLLDAFSDPVFNEIRLRNKTGAVFLCTFFRPSSGLKSTGGQLYVQYALYQRLRKLFDLTSEGGLLFLQAPVDDTDTEFVKELLKRYEAPDLISSGDAVALLKKDRVTVERSKLPAENGHKVLPPIEEIVEKHWDLLMRYWTIPKPRVRIPATKS